MNDLNSKRRLMARFLNKEPAWGVDPLPFQKTAGFPPPPPMDEGSGDVDVGGKRNIPKDHPFDPKSLKPLAKALWAASVGMGHALTSYRFISRIKSSTISPDGMIGGRGYVMNVNDARKKIHEACELLSSVTDSLYDEVNAPHWKPRLAELDENDAEDVERFVEESKAILENPEADAEEEAQEIEEENDGPGGTKKAPQKEPSGASEIPGGKELAPSMATGMATKDKTQTLDKQSKRLVGRMKQANSSLPVGTLPGGPRIEHLDRQDPDPNPQDAYTNDDWGLPSGGKAYDYPSEWDNNLNENQASSGIPDAKTEPTPTEGWDFGLGYGAHGQGAGGYENPSGAGDGIKGVWGPASGLPGNPAGSSGDTTPALDSATSTHEATQWKAASIATFEQLQAEALIPNDGDRPVARSDYYPGDRGNLVNTQLAQSGLPGEPAPHGEASPGLINTDYVTEDVSTPYVRYDYTTHDYRDDPLHNWPQRHLRGTNDNV